MDDVATQQKFSNNKCYASTYIYILFTSMGRAIHGSSRIGFVVDMQPTQSNRVNGKETRSRPNVQVEPNGISHRLSGSKTDR